MLFIILVCPEYACVTTEEFECCSFLPCSATITHWGQVTHICVSKLTTIGSDNGLSPGRRQAIIWTIAGILLTGPSGTNFSEILIEIHLFSIKKKHLKMSSGKQWPFCLSLNVLKHAYITYTFSVLNSLNLKQDQCKIKPSISWSLFSNGFCFAAFKRNLILVAYDLYHLVQDEFCIYIYSVTLVHISNQIHYYI